MGTPVRLGEETADISDYYYSQGEKEQIMMMMHRVQYIWKLESMVGLVLLDSYLCLCYSRFGLFFNILC